MLLLLFVTVSLLGIPSGTCFLASKQKDLINDFRKVNQSNGRISHEFVGKFDMLYKMEISKSAQYSWTFVYEDYDGVEPVVQSRVNSRTNVATPVIFEVRHHQSQSWTLPVVVSGELRTIYNEVNKTLCSPPENIAVGVKQSIEVIVSTKSEDHTTFTLRVTLKNIKITSLNQNTIVTVTPTSPVYFKLGPLIENNLRSPYIRLEVNQIINPAEKNKACFTVSLQNSTCPVQDVQNNVGYKSISHTMSTTATIPLHRDYFKEERFLVFIMHHDYSYCDSSQEIWKDQLLEISNVFDANDLVLSTRQLEFVIHESISTTTYVTATFGIAAIFLFVSIVFAAIHLWYLQNSSFANRDRFELMGPDEPSTNRSTYSLCFLIFHVKDYNSRRDISLENACTKPSDEVSRSAHRYLGTFWVVSLFYLIPVVQFVLLYQRVLNKTGNEDLCYFNFKCLHPLGSLTAFNHVFSNIAYIFFGVLFLLIVNRVSRARRNRKHELENKGVFNHNGIYYTMGSALLVEGFMSSFYHICPTHLNFQFDTCFMYITAMLCLVKIYQSRHDNNASAITAFLFMALVVLLAVMTTIYQVWWLWMLITILHIGAILLLSVHLYSWGDWKFWNVAMNSSNQIPLSEKCRLLLKSLKFPFRPVVEPLAGFLIALNILNWAFAIAGYIMFYNSQDVASYILMLFLVNVAVYTGIYATLKMVVAKEQIPWPAWIYLGLSVPFWIAGMAMFSKTTAAWNKSQAESRELNAECALLGFYDYHDLWHFFSAFGMFFMFMFFFTLDDGLTETERDRIKVF